MKLSHQTVGEIMRTDVVTVREEATVRELARTLAEEGIGGAPVLDAAGRVVGVVSASDVLALAAREAPTGARLTEEGVGSGAREASPAAYYGCDESAAGGPLVLSLVPPASIDATTVGRIMSRTRHAVRPKTSVDELARLLLRAGIHRALVLDGGRLVGIVTTFDVLRCLVGDSETFGRRS